MPSGGIAISGRECRYPEVVTAPNCYLNQAFLIMIHTRGRPGKVPVGENSNSQDSLYGGD